MKIKDQVDIVVIGELNVDIILNRIGQFPEMGKEILAQSMNLTLGSSSAIFASNLSTLGSTVTFVGKIGTDGFASVVLDSLISKGVDTSHILKSKALNTGATIVMNYGQDCAKVTYPGAMEDLKIEDIDYGFLSTARHLHFSSIFLQPGMRESLPVLFAKAKSLGLTTSLDPQWIPAEKCDVNLHDLLPSVDVFMPNISELLMLTDTKSLEQGIEIIKGIAPNLTIIVKVGAEGAFGWKGGILVHQPAFLNSQVVDCIGAGDSFNAGFIHGFIKGRSLEQCLEYGALMGAVSTTCPGGTGAFESMEEVRKIAAEQFKMTI